MKRALIKRLYKDDSSQETVMLMEVTESKERFRITIPREKAAILALEGHGLNDRCSLYRLLSECIAHLGGALRSVAVNLDRSKGVNGAVSLARGAEVTWIKADVVELVAFALHLQIPIYLDVVEGPDGGEPRPTHQATELPSVFEDALTEIMISESGAEPASAERRHGRPCRDGDPSGTARWQGIETHQAHRPPRPSQSPLARGRGKSAPQV